MKTLDVRLSLNKRELRRQSETFSDDKNVLKVITIESDNSNKADGEFQFFASNKKHDKNKPDKENIVIVCKANMFKRNLLTKIRSLVNS